MYGKQIRLSRLIHYESNKTCIVPMDHGVSLGPVQGIQDIIPAITKIIRGGADAIVVHKGLMAEISKYPELSKKGRYIMHMSSSTIQSEDPTYKVLVATVEEAIKLGADGVSVHVNLGTKNEHEMIKDLGRISKACMEWGMPLLAMVYSHKTQKEWKHVAHGARLAQELGADLVKIGWLDSMEELDSVISSVSIPVVVAGGEKMDNASKLLQMVSDSLAAGVGGVAIGRNIFQNKYPEVITRLIAKMVHGDLRIQDCIYELKQTHLVV